MHASNVDGILFKADWCKLKLITPSLQLVVGILLAAALASGKQVLGCMSFQERPTDRTDKINVLTLQTL